MRFDDRYALAIRSSNLRSEEKTLHSAADITGAAGLAGRKHPLALALLRLFCGDDRSVGPIIELMTDKAVSKVSRQNEIDRVAASLIARLVLDWYRAPTCKQCGGHGYARMAGAPKLSDDQCGVCKGQGRRDFEALFPPNRLELARWLANDLECEIGNAGPAAMAALALRLDL